MLRIGVNMGFDKENKADLGDLRFAIKGMTRQQALYRLLRDELGRLGYWKRRCRGNPRRGYVGMTSKIGTNHLFRRTMD